MFKGDACGLIWNSTHQCEGVSEEMASLLSTPPPGCRWSSSSSSKSHVNLPNPNSTPLSFRLIRVKSRYTSATTRVVCRSSSSPSSSAAAVGTKHPNRDAKRVGGSVLVLSEGRDEDERLGIICPGCGVFMQNDDPNRPGFYQPRKDDVLTDADDDEQEASDYDDNDVDIVAEFTDKDDNDEFENESDEGSEKEDEFDWDSDDDWDDEKDEEDEVVLAGFAPAGVGYGNITEEVLNKTKRKKVSKSERKRIAREALKNKEEVTVCARCHSLRNYGQVKNEKVENLIPDFDFNRLITTRLMKPTGTADSTVVVMVVDCSDFDGSFPKRAASSLFQALENTQKDSKLGKRLPKLVLVATKVDLLPSQISPTRLDRWVRHRAKANGAPRLNAVYLVSARKDLGVRNLLSFIKEAAGPRGNVWVIGAQNAGKSTLINTFAKREGVNASKLTEAAVPGTTLGIIRIGGILSAKAKMFDTPGLLHPYLMTMRLNRDEQKMVEIRKELQPRSYRMKAGQTVFVGGLMRLDLDEASVQTIYITVWASPNISLHMGKTENADETWRKHAGVRLQPPISEDRLSELGEWRAREIKASGSSWDVNSVDIAAAGLGWFSLGLKGEAKLTLWTYDGIDITERDPLIMDRAPFLERPGFWLPKAISEALGKQSKVEARKKELAEEEEFTSSSLNVL